MHEAIANTIADILGELLRHFLRATVRLARYALSARYRAEINDNYRDRNRWSKWWYLSRGMLPTLLAVLGISALFLWPRTAPDETRHHWHLIKGAEQSLMNRLHKPHPQD